MLDLAISIDTDRNNINIVETNHGVELKAPGWPNDCDFQLVAFDPSGETCEVISAEGLAKDIGEALRMIDSVAAFKGRKPDWYRSLELYAK
ncbi:MAG: hypothetical protein ABSG25_02305 [Bryobacteraceae bacterium]